MSFEIKGLKELQDKLNTIGKNANKLDGQSVPFTEILNNDFIQKHSSFNSFDDLVEASGFTVESQEDFEAIPDDKWDDFISQKTNFNSWQDMMDSASAIYAKKHLGL